MKIHAIAEELPQLSDAEFKVLVEDIRQHGLLQPVTVDSDGLLLDGRHRVRACQELGVAVTTVVVVGTEEEKRERSRSLNDIRRHLTESQRALRAAKSVNVQNGSNRFQTKVGTPRGVPTVSVADSAKSNGVSDRSVTRAKVVIDHGIDELIAAVDSGKVSVNVAEKIAKLPESEQLAAIANGFKVPSAPRGKKPSAPVVANDLVAITPEPEIPGVQETTVSLPEQIQSELTRLLDMLVGINRNSEEAKQISESVNKFHATVCSLCCDMAPIEPVEETKKVSGALFPEVAEEIEFDKRMEPTEGEFAAFYRAFPRRVNRNKSQTAFTSAFKFLRKKHSPEESINIIMRGVEVYDMHANPEALCHPTTWLNGHRWEDEPEGIGNKPVKSASYTDYGTFQEDAPDWNAKTTARQRSSVYGEYREKSDEEYKSF